MKQKLDNLSSVLRAKEKQNHNYQDLLQEKMVQIEQLERKKKEDLAAAKESDELLIQDVKQSSKSFIELANDTIQQLQNVDAIRKKEFQDLINNYENVVNDLKCLKDQSQRAKKKIIKLVEENEVLQKNLQTKTLEVIESNAHVKNLHFKLTQLSNENDELKVKLKNAETKTLVSGYD